ncbi:MAG: MbcA/ParS/Xre antitoxin family protein [Thiopseudomonas sp.]
MYKSLHLLFPTQSNADRWLITANDNALFSGSTPIDLLMAGGLIDLSTVRDYLEAVRCER